MTRSTFTTLTKTQRGKITQMGGTEKLIEKFKDEPKLNELFKKKKHTVL